MKGLSPQKGVPMTYSHDVAAEGCYPKKFEIKLKNQTEIRNWWNSFKKNGKYCPHDWTFGYGGKNCANVVATALQTGGKIFNSGLDIKEMAAWTPQLLYINLVGGIDNNKRQSEIMWDGDGIMDPGF
eukprot:31389_1